MRVLKSLCCPLVIKKKTLLLLSVLSNTTTKGFTQHHTLTQTVRTHNESIQPTCVDIYQHCQNYLYNSVADVFVPITCLNLFHGRSKINVFYIMLLLPFQLSKLYS